MVFLHFLPFLQAQYGYHNWLWWNHILDKLEVEFGVTLSQVATNYKRNLHRRAAFNLIFWTSATMQSGSVALNLALSKQTCHLMQHTLPFLDSMWLVHIHIFNSVLGMLHSKSLRCTYEMMQEDDNICFNFLSLSTAIGGVGMQVGKSLCKRHPCHPHLYENVHLLPVSVCVCGVVSNVRLSVLIPRGSPCRQNHL